MVPENKENTPGISTCFNPLAKKQLFIGVVGIAIITVFSMAMFRPQPDTKQQTQMFSQQRAVQYAPQHLQQAPYSTRNFSPVTCPFCGFTSSNPAVTPNGMFTCPNCARNTALPAPPQSGGTFTQAAFQTGRNTHPNYARGFVQGQQIAFTNPLAPPITRDAVMPHPFRGVCSNCHQILETPAGIGAMR